MIADERLFTTPPGVKLASLDAVADGAARNFVVQMRAGASTASSSDRATRFTATSIAVRTWGCRWRRFSTAI